MSLIKYMRLFLSGGGVGRDSAELDDLFAASVDKSKPLLYIPIANKIPRSLCLEFIKNTFIKRGIEKYEMWTEKDFFENNLVDLRKFGGVYIGGGNTFYLLHILKKTNMFKRIKNAVESGVPYYGGSAGAILCGSSIEIAKIDDENIVNLKDKGGMNFLSGYSLICHYSEEKQPDIKKLAEQLHQKIIALPENSGLECKEDSIKVIGSGSAFIFEKTTYVKKPNERIC